MVVRAAQNFSIECARFAVLGCVIREHALQPRSQLALELLDINSAQQASDGGLGWDFVAAIVQTPAAQTLAQRRGEPLNPFGNGGCALRTADGGAHDAGQQGALAVASSTLGAWVVYFCQVGKEAGGVGGTQLHGFDLQRG